MGVSSFVLPREWPGRAHRSVLAEPTSGQHRDGSAAKTEGCAGLRSADAGADGPEGFGDGSARSLLSFSASRGRFCVAGMSRRTRPSGLSPSTMAFTIAASAPDIARFARSLDAQGVVLVGTAIVRYRRDASAGGLIRCRPLPFRKANGHRERQRDGGLAKGL